MSFVKWILALIVSASQSSAHLIDFVHALDVSLALGLGYSILIRLGNLSGKNLDAWAEREKLRVLGLYYEERNFNRVEYERRVDRCREMFKRMIVIENRCFTIWCMAAALGALIALTLIPFNSKLEISGQVVMQNAFLLAGPVPFGIIALCVTHCAAKGMLLYHAWIVNEVVGYQERKLDFFAAAQDAIGQQKPPPPSWLSLHGKKVLIAILALAALVTFFYI